MNKKKSLASLVVMSVGVPGVLGLSAAPAFAAAGAGVDDVVTISQDQQAVFNVLTNDTPAGEASTSLAKAPEHGELTLSADGSATYAPSDGFVGDDSFDYDVIVDGSVVGSATVKVSVTALTEPAPEVTPESAETTATPTSAPTPTETEAPVGLEKDVPVPSSPEVSAPAPAKAPESVAPSQRVAGVAAENQAPVFTDAAANTYQEPRCSTPLQALSATDPDGDALTYALVSGSLPPGVTLSSDGTFVGTVAATVGYFTAQISVTDSSGASALTTLAVRLGGSGGLGDDTFTVNANSSTILPLANNDADAANRSYQTPSDPPHGTLTFEGDFGSAKASPRYTPDPGFSGVDTFSYGTYDYATSNSYPYSSALVRVNVLPTAAIDSVRTQVNQALTVDPLANDAGSFDRSTLNVTNVVGGTVESSIASPGTVVFTPAQGFVGRAGFDYDVKDTSGQSTSSSVTIVVDPVLVDDSFKVAPGQQIALPVFDNDLGDFYRSETRIGTEPLRGTIVQGEDGTIFYTAPESEGPDYFTYRIPLLDADGNPTGSDSTATVTIDVTAAAVPPATQPDQFVVDGGSSVVLDVLTNDSGDVDPATLQFDFVNSESSQIVMRDGKYVFESLDGSGETYFYYTVANDAGVRSAPTGVSVKVNPVGVDDVASTKTDVPVKIRVIDNDKVSLSPFASLEISDAPDHGSVTFPDFGGDFGVIDKNVPTYTPDPGFVGTDTFVYQGSDYLGAPFSATVTVTVGDPVVVTPPPTPVDPAPVASPDVASGVSSSSVIVDVLKNDTGSLVASTLQVTSQPSSGAAEVRDGKVVYTPGNSSGKVSFTYQVQDTSGRIVSSTVEVTVTPKAADDSFKVGADALTLDVLANDLGSIDPASLTLGTPAAHGKVSVVDGVLTYTPDLGYQGSDTFVYMVSDTSRQVTSGTVTLDVAAGAPVTPEPTTPTPTTPVPTAPVTPPVTTPAPTVPAVAPVAVVTSQPQASTPVASRPNTRQTARPVAAKPQSSGELAYTGAESGFLGALGVGLLGLGGLFVRLGRRPRRH